MKIKERSQTSTDAGYPLSEQGRQQSLVRSRDCAPRCGCVCARSRVREHVCEGFIEHKRELWG